MEEKVKAWIKAKTSLYKAKTAELELRKDLCDHILQGSIKGSKTAKIGPYKLSAKATLNMKIDKDALKVIWSDLTPEEKQSVRFKPELIAKEYKKLDEKCIIHQTVTSTPGTPSLEVKEA